MKKGLLLLFFMTIFSTTFSWQYVEFEDEMYKGMMYKAIFQLSKDSKGKMVVGYVNNEYLVTFIPGGIIGRRDVKLKIELDNGVTRKYDVEANMFDIKSTGIVDEDGLINELKKCSNIKVTIKTEKNVFINEYKMDDFKKQFMKLK